MYCHDIALAFQLLGFVKYIQTENGVKPTICVDWKKVDAHADRVSKSKTRIYIDHECLRWTPLLTPTVNPFREEKSDNEKDAPKQETADIVVPLPEKIILETQQGVKMRKGRKRKISGTPKIQKTPRNEKSAAPAVPESTLKVEEEHEVEITSSGRRRTRPSKFNETTYADVKPKAHEGSKRKRNESATSDKDPLEIEKKKPKVETPVVEKPKTGRRSAAVADTPAIEETPKAKGVKKAVVETPEINAQSTRSRRSATASIADKTSERWSQRRKRLQTDVKAKETEEKPVEKPVVEMPKLKPVDESPSVTESSAVVPALLPQVKKVKQRRKKRGWVKGRSRAKLKQLTLPEFIKIKRESESESILSDEENKKASSANHNIDVHESKSGKTKEDIKRASRISAEEDSSAEADDEMENDELLPKERAITSPNTKYKYANLEKNETVKKQEPPEKSVKEEPEKAQKTVEADKVQVSETKEQEAKVSNSNSAVEEKVPDKEEAAVKARKSLIPDEPVIPADYSTSESETEIDGHKIKSISHREILEISKQSTNTLPPKEEDKVNKDSQKSESVEEKPIEAPKEAIENTEIPPEPLPALATETEKVKAQPEPIVEPPKIPEEETNACKEKLTVVPKVEEAVVAEECKPKSDDGPKLKSPVIANDIPKQVVEKSEPKAEERTKKSVSTETDIIGIEKQEKKSKPDSRCPTQEVKEPVKPKEEPKVQPKQESPPKVEARHKQEKYEDKRFHQKHEEKSFETKPKMSQLENENLLAKQEFAMASSNYMTQAQYQWQWERLAWEKGIYFDHKRDYQSYAMPLHIPSIDVLPKQLPTEKEKSMLKSHRHESKSGTKNKDGKEKSSPKKDERTKAKTEALPNQVGEVCRSSVIGAQLRPIDEKTIPKAKPSEIIETAPAIETHHKLDDSLQQPVTQLPASLKHTPPTPSAPDIPSMGVYTPDSTTNSVHSLHYGQCDIEMSQLGLESPTSISSDMASQNSVEAVRPPSVIPSHQQPPVQVPQPPPQTNYDCTIQHNLQNSMHSQVQQNITVPASSPTVNNPAMQMPTGGQHQVNSSKRQMQQQRNR